MSLANGRLCILRLSYRRLAVVFVLLSLAPYARSQQHAKNVLVINSSFDRRSLDTLDLIEAPVRAHFLGQVNFHTTYLIPEKSDDASYRESLAEVLSRQYSDVKLDAVVAYAVPAIPFAVEYRDRIFPGVPIVFLAVTESELEGQKLLPGMTGVTTTMGLGSTIDLALRLQPDTNAVAVINGEPNFWWRVAHAELLRRQNKVKEIDILGQPSAEMLQKIAALPPHTVVLFQLAPAGATEPTISNYDVLTAAAQRLPTYSAWSLMCLNYGCIGGAYPRWEEDFRMAGDMLARVLSGERVQDIPVVHSTNLQVRVDSRALRRWKIPETALPPGSVVLYREPTIWERYRKYVVAVVALIAVQFLLIIGLLWQRARRRKAQTVLRESEKRFRLMADTTPSLIWMCDAAGKITYLNEPRVAFTGSQPNVGYGDAWAPFVHTDDLKKVLGVLLNGIKSHEQFSMKYRLRRQDGVYRWMFDVAAPRVNGDGSFAGFIGSAVDVTDQKMAQEALEKVSGQLIEAQEKERSRLARELHDDICQRLAMLSIKIEKVNKAVSREHVSDQLGQIWKECSDLASDVQALSHELHPSILDHLGLATAVKGFCRDISDQNGVAIDLVCMDIPSSLPRDISLSVFRVIQEAIHNAIKYSGEKHFEVRLQANDTEVELEVIDQGTGFDAAPTRDGRGLGLVSMAERIHQVNGTFTIVSQPNVGTRIRAHVPLVTRSKTMAATPN